MELYFILMVSVVFLALSVIDIVELGRDYKSHEAFLAYALLAYSMIMILFISYYARKPSPIDVYRNKTTLEITYKDRVPIDSTVVWK